MEFDLTKDNVLDFKDIFGKRVLFRKVTYLTHLTKHWELEGMANRIVQTINEPDVIYKSPKYTNRFCFYRFAYKVNTTSTYIKVVDVCKKVYIIVTAFRMDHVQEQKYSKPCERP